MSLQYIIDAYNLIRHPLCAPHAHKIRTPRLLAAFIRLRNLTGSAKNKVVIVFDGFAPEESSQACSGIGIIFSGEETADEYIHRMVESTSQRRTLIVVSDDKQVQMQARLLGACTLGIEDFMGEKKKSHRQRTRDESKPELTYAQVCSITKELKKLWLQE